jgi:hypothetical protein
VMTDPKDRKQEELPGMEQVPCEECGAEWTVANLGLCPVCFIEMIQTNKCLKKK